MIIIPYVSSIYNLPADLGECSIDTIKTMSDILISQTWFHIEAIYYPHPCHRIRHVMDVLVPVELDSSKKNNRFLYPLAKPFAEVRVYARNDKKNEIGFIEVSNGIVLSLQYNNFPKIEENSLEYYHIKLEVEYLKIDITSY